MNTRKIRFVIAVLCISLFVALSIRSFGWNYGKKVFCKDKLNQGALSLNNGRIINALSLFKEAAEICPGYFDAWLMYGIALHRQYKTIGESQRDRTLEEALEACNRAFEIAGSDHNCQSADRAMSYIAGIYDDLGDKDARRQWMLSRAESDCATNQLKSTTYYSIAAGYWKCAYDQTSRYQNKNSKDPNHYRNMDYPAASADKRQTEECIVNGIEFIDKATKVDPEFVDAYLYKGLLLREKQKMTKPEAERMRIEDSIRKLAAQADALKKQ